MDSRGTRVAGGVVDGGLCRELFDNRNHHYDVYSKAFDQAIKPAIEWYEQHLK